MLENGDSMRINAPWINKVQYSTIKKPIIYTLRLILLEGIKQKNVLGEVCGVYHIRTHTHTHTTVFKINVLAA